MGKLKIAIGDNRSISLKFQGSRNDVSEVIALEKGLYIIAYQYSADDEFPIFSIEIENIATKTKNRYCRLSAG